MADTTTSTAPTTKPTLGLTGLTSNAMALIAPGAFLWLTFQEQALYGAPIAGQSMWFGIVAALLLCLATAVSYAELSKLYPGAGSSYFYAEQAFLSKTKMYKWARVIKFFTGWASHLYYWVYPGCMVGVTAILSGYLLNQFFPNTFSGSYDSPLFMILFCIVFSFGVAYIAFRGVGGTTVVNMMINVIQIGALLIFSVIALGYRLKHPQGSQAIHLSNGTAVNYNVDQVPVTDANNQPVPATWADGSTKYQTDDKGNTLFTKDAKGNPVLDKDGKPVPLAAISTQDRQVTDDDLDPAKNKDAVLLAELKTMGLSTGDPYPVFDKDKDGKLTPEPFAISYLPSDAITGTAGDPKDPLTFNFHSDAGSVVAPHSMFNVMVQAGVAILILVGFESVTAMGEEAKNPRKDIPKAVILALVIQGAFCYLLEYFCANYFMNNGYGLTNAGASGAPIGDMMVIAGTWFFGSYSAGRAFMLVQALTVFLALIGTTLSCLSTGARVTYAMGRDDEVPSHFGMLHGRTLSPHRAIWTLAVISAILGVVTVSIYLGGQSADLAPLDKQYNNIWYSFGIFSPHAYTYLPNTLLIVTLISNFGTFLLYMTTCIVAIVAFVEHHSFNTFKHVVIPVFGLVANFLCMLFYLVGPFFVAGMSKKEPYIALGVAAIWGIYGLIYFSLNSKAKNKEMFLSSKPVTTV
jgi:basic amino acid/polyamine antiporter, APA family